MDIYSALFAGIALGLGLAVFIAFVSGLFPKKKAPVCIGKLYIHERPNKDTYSFAFDCELDEVKIYDEVALKIERKKGLDEDQIIKNMEEQYYGEELGDRDA